MQYAYGINVRFETRRRYYVCIELFLTKALHGTQHLNLLVESQQEKRAILATALLISLSILTSPERVNRRKILRLELSFRFGGSEIVLVYRGPIGLVVQSPAAPIVNNASMASLAEDFAATLCCNSLWELVAARFI